jgi:ABC-2 type transport system ATP-binding protein
VLDRIKREARNGRTVLLTTQVLSEAEELCDRIMIVHQGKTLAAGSLQELRRLSTQVFRVSLTFATGRDMREHLQSLDPVDLRIEGERVELVFKGEEALLLGRLADLSRVVPIRHFEVRGAGLEDIFVELVGEKYIRREPET